MLPYRVAFCAREQQLAFAARGGNCGFLRGCSALLVLDDDVRDNARDGYHNQLHSVAHAPHGSTRSRTHRHCRVGGQMGRSKAGQKVVCKVN
jgi:hypothetical protein